MNEMVSVAVPPGVVAVAVTACGPSARGDGGVYVQPPAPSVGTVIGVPPSMTRLMVPSMTEDEPVMAGVVSAVVDPSPGVLMAMEGGVMTVKRSSRGHASGWSPG